MTASARSGYFVLGKAEGGWVELGVVAAAKTAREAVKQAYDKQSGHDDGPFTAFVAVPARSWQPVTVAAKTTLVLGEAS